MYSVFNIINLDCQRFLSRYLFLSFVFGQQTAGQFFLLEKENVPHLHNKEYNMVLTLVTKETTGF